MPTTKTFNGTSYTFPTDFQNFGYADIWESFWDDVGTALDATTSYNDLTALGTTPANGDFFPIYDLDATTYKKVAYSDLGIGGGSGGGTYRIVTTDASSNYTDDDGFIYNDSAATTDHVQLLGASMANAPSSGDYIRITDASLTSGAALDIYSNSPDATARYLIDIHNDDASASQTRLIRLKQDANKQTMQIDALGTSTGGAGILSNGDSVTSGSNIRAQCGSASFSGAVFYARAQNASASGDAFYAEVEGTGAAFATGGTPATAVYGSVPASGWHNSISSLGTLTAEIPFKIGSTVYYIPVYTAGS